MKKTKLILANIIASIILMVLLFIWAGEVNKLRMVDVTFGVAVFFIGASWLIFATNLGTLDMFVYGTKRFFLVLLNKKDKIENTFFDYKNNKKEKVEKHIFYTIGITGMVYLIVSMVLYFMWY